MSERGFIPPTPRKGMSKARATRIFLACNGRCGICGQQIRGESYEIEHPTALNLGGSDDDARLVPVHVKCHRAKTRADVAEIAKRNRIITAGWADKPKGRPMPGSRASPFKHKLNGQTERR